jgi:hypothetical protein
LQEEDENYAYTFAMLMYEEAAAMLAEVAGRSTIFFLEVGTGSRREARCVDGVVADADTGMGSGEGIMTRQTKNIEQYEVNHYYKKLKGTVVNIIPPQHGATKGPGLLWIKQEKIETGIGGEQKKSLLRTLHRQSATRLGVGLGNQATVFEALNRDSHAYFLNSNMLQSKDSACSAEPLAADEAEAGTSSQQSPRETLATNDNAEATGILEEQSMSGILAGGFFDVNAEGVLAAARESVTSPASSTTRNFEVCCTVTTKDVAKYQIGDMISGIEGVNGPVIAITTLDGSAVGPGTITTSNSGAAGAGAPSVSSPEKLQQDGIKLIKQKTAKMAEVLRALNEEEREEERAFRKAAEEDDVRMGVMMFSKACMLTKRAQQLRSWQNEKLQVDFRARGNTRGFRSKALTYINDDADDEVHPLNTAEAFLPRVAPDRSASTFELLLPQLLSSNAVVSDLISGQANEANTDDVREHSVAGF